MNFTVVTKSGSINIYGDFGQEIFMLIRNNQGMPVVQFKVSRGEDDHYQLMDELFNLAHKSVLKTDDVLSDLRNSINSQEILGKEDDVPF